MQRAQVSQISAGTCSPCHVPSIGSFSQFCLILQPHRVAVPFPPTFTSPWRKSFVQIHGRTTLLKAKFGTTPQKRPKNDLNWGVGSSGTNNLAQINPLFQTHCFPMNFEISLTSRSLVSIGTRQQFSLLYIKALDFMDAEINAIIFSSFDSDIDTCWM